MMLLFLMTESSSSSSYSPSSTIPRKALIDMFRPHLIDSSKVLQVVFVHLVHNSTLFLAPWCCSFLLHVIANLICILLDSRQLVLLSPHVKLLHSFCSENLGVKNSISNDVSRFLSFCLGFRISFLWRISGRASALCTLVLKISGSKLFYNCLKFRVF
jgi:hypothetical protein